MSSAINAVCAHVHRKGVVCAGCFFVTAITCALENQNYLMWLSFTLCAVFAGVSLGAALVERKFL